MVERLDSSNRVYSRISSGGPLDNDKPELPL